MNNTPETPEPIKPFVVYTATGHGTSDADQLEYARYEDAQTAHQVAETDSRKDTDHVYIVREDGVRGYTSYYGGTRVGGTAASRATKAGG